MTTWHINAFGPHADDVLEQVLTRCRSACGVEDPGSFVTAWMWDDWNGAFFHPIDHCIVPAAVALLAGEQCIPTVGNCVTSAVLCVNCSTHGLWGVGGDLQSSRLEALLQGDRAPVRLAGHLVG